MEPLFASPQDAIIGLMYAMARIDHETHEDELKEILKIVRSTPVFEGYDDGAALGVTETVLSLFDGLPSDDPEACRALAAGAKDALPEHLYETALALVCDIAAADLEFHPSEPGFLVVIRTTFGVSPLFDHALRYAAKVRKRRLNAGAFPDAASEGA